jgi:hypothetical protein
MRLAHLSPLFAALALSVSPVPAAAELMIAPTRIVMGPGERSTELTLVNKGNEQTAFRLAVENRRMRRDGALEAAETPRTGELFAADMIHFAPRRVILEPGARQTIRVSVDTPAGLAPGEYRSHLRLMSAPTGAAQPNATPGSAEADDKSLSIELVAVRSLTIPVIIRVGTLDATATIDGATLARAPEDMLVVKMARTGTRSTYGDLRLTLDGQSQPVYVVRGIAIYTPNSDRDVLLPLPADVRQKIAGHALRIDYVSTDAKSPGLIASRNLKL